MKPFNIELYARSAEEALHQIAAAKRLDADALRTIATNELCKLKFRYRHNGYISIQVDQRAAQEGK